MCEMNSLLISVSEQTIQEQLQKDFGLLSCHAAKKPLINEASSILQTP